LSYLSLGEQEIITHPEKTTKDNNRFLLIFIKY
jgi:hypothetical protein